MGFYGIDPLVMTKIAIEMAHFHSYVKSPEGKLYSQPLLDPDFVFPVYPHCWEKRIAGLLTRPSYSLIYSQVFSSSMHLLQP